MSGHMPCMSLPTPHLGNHSNLSVIYALLRQNHAEDGEFTGRLYRHAQLAVGCVQQETGRVPVTCWYTSYPVSASV